MREEPPQQRGLEGSPPGDSPRAATSRGDEARPGPTERAARDVTRASELDAPAGTPRSTVPALLDRSALERVLGRAAELQAAEGGHGEGTLSEEQLIDIGKEVGLSPRHLRQALAEERTRLSLPQDSGWAGRIAGPATATASRTIRGKPAEVLATLDSWMQREECLQVKRRFSDRITWEARADLLGRLRRDFNLGGRGYHLARAHEVAATVIPVDAERVFVRLDADLSSSRAARLRTGGAVAVTGVGAGAAWLLLASTFLPPALGSLLIGGVAIAVLPAAAGVGVARQITRAHARNVSRAQLALEQALDRLERGELSRPPGLLQQLTSGLK